MRAADAMRIDMIVVESETQVVIIIDILTAELTERGEQRVTMAVCKVQLEGQDFLK